MMESAAMWIVAGPNGAGKSTLVNRAPLVDMLENAQLLNTDDRTLEKLRKLGYGGFQEAPSSVLDATFISAAREVEAELPIQLQLGHKVCVETVLSTEKYKSIVKMVNAGGGFVGLIYVGIRSPELLAARIAARVRRGGHDVPLDRLAPRWKRSIEMLPWFVAHSDAYWIYDNTDSSEFVPPVLIARGARGRVRVSAPDAIPEITAALAPLEAKE